MTVAALSTAFETISHSAIAQAGDAWTDEGMTEAKQVFGIGFPLGKWLGIMVRHEVHHRGQLTVLLKQNGLSVPGIYGG